MVGLFCPFSSESWYLPVRYVSSSSVTWLVCSAWEFTEIRVTTLWVILTEYFSSEGVRMRSKK